MENFRMDLKSVSCFVHLGCSEEERFHPQEVCFRVQIRFLDPPEACNSDLLTDSVCYTKIAESLSSTCKMKHYKMLEHLGMNALKNLRNLLPSDQYQVSLQLHKLHPPHPLLATHGVEIQLGDF